MSNSREQLRERFNHLRYLIITTNLDEFKSVVKIDDLGIKFNYVSLLRIPFTGTLVPFCATYFRLDFIEYLLETFIIPNKKLNIDDAFQLGRTVAIIQNYSDFIKDSMGTESKKITEQCIACYADLNNPAVVEIPEEFQKELDNSHGCKLM